MGAWERSSVTTGDWPADQRRDDRWERKRPLPPYPIAPMEKQSIYSGAGYQIRDLLDPSLAA